MWRILNSNNVECEKWESGNFNEKRIGMLRCAINTRKKAWPKCKGRQKRQRAFSVKMSSYSQAEDKRIRKTRRKFPKLNNENKRMASKLT